MITNQIDTHSEGQPSVKISIDSMRSADASARLLEAALNQTSLLKAVLPNDVESHRDRFIRDMRRGRPRSPVFTYPETDSARFQPLQQIVEEYSSHSNPLSRFIADEASRHLARFRACISHEADQITQAMSEENEVPDEALLAEAVKLLGARKIEIQSEEEREFSAVHVLSAVER